MLFIILRLNEHILTTLCVAVLSGTVNLAPKITEVRRKELAFANELWKSGVVLQTFDYSEYPENFIGPIRPTWEYVKGHTYLITLTNSHNAGHSLLSQREGQKKSNGALF